MAQKRIVKSRGVARGQSTRQHGAQSDARKGDWSGRVSSATSQDAAKTECVFDAKLHSLLLLHDGRPIIHGPETSPRPRAGICSPRPTTLIVILAEKSLLRCAQSTQRHLAAHRLLHIASLLVASPKSILR
ncbi:hypothetical protein MKEN_00305700 [Mycena kentingensis (nom. inval.)]|nr:hypothetical protein MKEN_00305700 [Mycena kentingensis (nom. inval.)]